MFYFLNLHCNYVIFLLESEVTTMKRKNTSIRLKEIMKDRNLKQVDILKLAQPFSEEYHIKLNNSDVSQYLSGKSEPGQDKLFILGMALDVNESWLMGFDVPKERYNVQTSQYIENKQVQQEMEGLSGIFAGIDDHHSNQKHDFEYDRLNSRDKKDIAKDLDNIMHKLQSGEDGPATFDGQELSPESAELFKIQLESMLTQLKVINKEKYNPNKNKK